MPRTKPLTQAQREREANDKRRKSIANVLTAYKSDRNLTNEEFAMELGICRNSMGYILKGREVRLETDKFFKLLDIYEFMAQKIAREAQKIAREAQKQ